ncbi:Dpi35 protein [Saccharomycopsis crataegensis]|uniref:Dpi35 protein n=1 Tax=Saccharomycopsis crataegensis TaxID=43959 RepID=A0AAV5QGJ0_9ASCO|nr:Dpi35 protein [Saccharomycopsis crataegensis]
MMSAIRGKISFPRVLSFDAFETLYLLLEPPFKTYHKFGLKYGIAKSPDAISKDFIVGFKEMELRFPNYGINNDLLIEEFNEFKVVDESNPVIRYSDNWWGLLISKAFHPYKVPFNMSKDLIEYFSGEAYYTDSCLVNTIKKMKMVDLSKFDEGAEVKVKNDRPILLINSNGDPRVKLILKHLQLVSDEMIAEDLVYISYNTQVEKPNKESFEYIINDLVKRGLLTFNNEAELLKYCWHFGDTYCTDLQGSINSGWNGILIDRNYGYDYFLEAKEQNFAKMEGGYLWDGDKKFIINDYKQLDSIFDT